VLQSIAADLALIRADDTIGIQGPPDFGWPPLTKGEFRLLRGAGTHGALLDEVNGPLTGRLLCDLLGPRKGTDRDDP
jgi:hypothetical protein